jgi:hypothetical protein
VPNPAIAHPDAGRAPVRLSVTDCVSDRGGPGVRAQEAQHPPQMKQASVKITPEGTVKVLDFGLVKEIEEAPAAAGLTNSPSLFPLFLTPFGVLDYNPRKRKFEEALNEI